MKKLIIICTIMVMALAMAMPCFASENEIGIYNGVELPPLPENMPFEHVIITYSNGVPFIYNTAKKYTYDGTAIYRPQTDAHYYKLKDGAWSDLGYDTTLYAGSVTDQFIWASYDIVDKYNGSVFWTYVEPIFPMKPIASSDWEDIYNKFTEQLTVKNIVTVLAVGAAAVVGIVFMWWGVRKLNRAVLTALRKGRVSA